VELIITTTTQKKILYLKKLLSYLGASLALKLRAVFVGGYVVVP